MPRSPTEPRVTPRYERKEQAHDVLIKACYEPTGDNRYVRGMSRARIVRSSVLLGHWVIRYGGKAQ